MNKLEQSEFDIANRKWWTFSRIRQDNIQSYLDLNTKYDKATIQKLYSGKSNLLSFEFLAGICLLNDINKLASLDIKKLVREKQESKFREKLNESKNAKILKLLKDKKITSKQIISKAKFDYKQFKPLAFFYLLIESSDLKLIEIMRKKEALSESDMKEYIKS